MHGGNTASTTPYDNMHPRQMGLDNRIHIGFYMLFVSFEVSFEIDVRGGAVRNNDRILANVLTYYFVQCVSAQIVNHKHLHVMDDFSDALPFCLFSQLGRFLYGLLRCLRQVLLQYCVNRLALNDDKYFGLLLASCATLNFLTACPFWKPYRKKRLVKFHLIRQLVYGIPLSHNVPQLHHHKPHGRILLYPQLVLDFLCGKHLFDGCHKVHSIEPGAERQLAVFHYRALGQGNAATAFLTLERFSPSKPFVGFVATIGTGNTLADANVSKIRHTGFLCRKTAFKLA